MEMLRITIPTVEDLQSYLGELRRQPQPSTLLVDILNELAGHAEVDIPQKLALSQEAYDLAVRLGYGKGQAYSLRHQSMANHRLGQRDQALTQALEALSLAQAIPDQALEANIHRVIGQITYATGLHSEGVAHCLEALRLYRALDDRQGEVEVFTVLAIIYNARGDVEQAIALDQQILAFYEESEDHPRRALILNNLAYTYLSKEDYAQAQALAEQSLRICEEMHQQQRSVAAYGDLLDTLAEIALRTGELDQALHYAWAAHASNRLPDETVCDSELEGSVLVNLSRIYRLRGDADIAARMLTAAIEHCTHTRHQQILARVHQEFAILEETRRQFAAALWHHKRFTAINQQIFNEQSEQQLRSLQILHVTEAAHREAAMYQQKNREQQAIISELEQTKHQLETALREVQQRTIEQTRLLAENERQRDTIQALSLPILPLSDTTLVMPLIGDLSNVRLRHLREQALRAIQRNSARWLLLDITGALRIDEVVAQSLITTVSAARLLGAEVILVGIRPQIACDLVKLGINLRTIRVAANLQMALQQLGMVA